MSRRRKDPSLPPLPHSRALAPPRPRPLPSLLLLPLMLLLLLPACGDGPTSPRAQRQYRVRDVHGATMTVRIGDARVAGEADRLLLSGEERWVTGSLVAGDGGFNAPWSWHLAPATVGIAEVTIEACQTDIGGIEGDLDYWLRFSREVGPVCVGGEFVARQ